MLKNDIQTYKQLQSFHDIQSLNNAVNAHKRVLSSPKLKNARAIFQLVAEHSCVYIGVSFLTQNSIAKKLGISSKTVQRAIDKLVEIGAVIKHACKRAGGDRRQTSNVIVIQPHVQAEVSDHKSELINQNINNTDDTKKEDFVRNEADKNSLLKAGLVTKLPPVLQRALAPFFDADELYALAGAVFKAKSSVDKSIRLEEHEAEYYHEIISIMNAHKRGKVHNLPGLLCHAIKSVTRTISRRMAYNLM